MSSLDDDDVWSPQELRRQCEALERSDGRKWAVSAMAFIDGGDRVLGIQYPETSPMLPALLRVNVIPGGGSGVVAETELVREAGGFDERFSNLADWDMWLRLAQLSAPAVALEVALEVDVGYYLHQGSMSRDIDRFRAERAQILEKYQDLCQDLYQEYAGLVDFADWHRYLGDMCLQSGRRREALREYSRAGLPTANRARLGANVAVALIAPDVHAWLRRRWRRLTPVPDAAAVEQWLQQNPPNSATPTGAVSLIDAESSS